MASLNPIRISFLVLLISWFILPVNGQTKATKAAPLIVKGYDVVAYFQGGSVRGNKAFELQYNGFTYRFSTADNLEQFRANPQQFVPAYEGVCAYGMAVAGKRYKINPKAFEIRDGRLFFFYKTIFYDALKRWQQENPQNLVNQADANWDKL